jgi:hypothetical protein
MAACKEVKTKKYQTRKSPPFHAKDCKNQTKKGKDGVYESKPDKRGVYAWKKISSRKNTTRKNPKKMQKGRTYQTHDNGARPFLVQDHGGSVTVTKQVWNAEKRQHEPEKELLNVPYEKIFVGSQGSSILLKQTKNQYTYIGDTVKTFESYDDDKILDYFSPIGNSDVPYPYAVGEKYTYLMIEDVAISNQALDKGKDPYEQHYGFGKYADTSIKKKIQAATKKLPMKVLVKRQYF